MQAQRKITVMVVDDDKVDVMAVERVVKHMEHAPALHIATSASEALELLEQLDTSCLILLDLNLPKMNGFEFLDELQRRGGARKSVVFVWTTSSDPRDVELAYSKNVAGYLVKGQLGPRSEGLAAIFEAFRAYVLLPG